MRESYLIANEVTLIRQDAHVSSVAMMTSNVQNRSGEIGLDWVMKATAGGYLVIF